MRVAGRFQVFFLVGLLMATPLAQAAQCQANSGPQRVALLELYTSEGCSSCPPADRWLSSMVSQGMGPDRVVPLALHVDYWDYIGWPDRFARASFAARQRELVRLAGARVVYTPQVMLNARDFSAWRGNGLARAAGEINRLPAAAEIGLTLTNAAPGSLDILAKASTKAAGRAVLYVAVYQNGLSSDVRAGENSGVRLNHDYVVREWYGPISVGAGAPLAWQQAISFKPDWHAKQMGVAAFVQDASSGEILQALQLPFCAA
jgi:hypothetical protein